MPKKIIFLRILAAFVFVLSSAAFLAACFYVRPLVLKRAETVRAENLRQNLKAVLPAFDNEPWNEAFEVRDVKIFPARRGEKVSLPGSPDLEQEQQTVTASVLKGFAFQMPARDGEGKNPVWIGIDGEGNITGFKPSDIRQSRVPENFTENIPLRTRASKKLTEAVENGKEFFEMHRNFFFTGAHQAQIAGETS